MNKRLAQMIVFTAIAFGLLAIATTDGQAAGETTAQVAAPPPPGFPVKIGIVVPLSGPVKSFGESTRDGALVAIQQAEDAGWTIETVYGDSQCDAQQAVSVTEDLILNQGVRYVIGAVCSSASVSMSEVTDANQVVQIAPPSTNPDVTKYDDGTNKEYVFRACFLEPFQGKVMATVAREDLGATDAAVLYDEGNLYVSGLAQYFKGYFEDMGGTVSVFESYTGGTADFSDLLTQVDDANVDVLFAPDYYSTVNEIAQQADTMGLQTTFLGADGWDSPDLELDLLEGAYFSTHFWPGDSRQVVVDFVEAYSATYGTEPDVLAALGYDATDILLESIAETGVDDPTQVKDAIADIAYDGVTGKIAFDEYGDPLKQAAIVKIEGGETQLAKYVALHVTGLAATNDSPTNLGEPTTFTATVETGSNMTHTWAFGDGSIGSGRVVSHTYATAGLYTAVVTASNEYNSEAGQTVAVVREQVTIASGDVVTTSDKALSIASSPALTQTLLVTYTPQIAPGHSTGDFEAGGVAFHLQASYLPGGTPAIGLAHPLTVTIQYNEDDLPSYLDEADLEVRRYDVGLEEWVPLQVVSRDLANDQITVLLDHFSEFALLVPVKHVYLPLVLRSY